ncbi:MAG TPA: sulfatase-like hydrolase/transferase [Mycobacteriales bacterium]|nr:sulfatase-like hydrolase/transferase [Mycobacteriales bacterium]
MPDYEVFDGVIGTTHLDSTPSYPRREPPPGGPNIVLIVLDDTGFAQFGCYGSTIETPNIDRLASEGLRYSNFHVTPLCSPTRAALLTGANHHTVGMRAVANFNTGFPNMRGAVSHHAVTIAEVLRDANYATFALGKWHLCPAVDASAAGPYDQWPLQRGFDRFYGFLDGETDQFHPDLVYDNHRIDPPRTPEQGYHLSEDLVDHAVEFVHDAVSIRPDRPFFLYLAFGATHAPHQAPAAYLEKYRGRFDVGWDAIRDQWFARQRELGLVPAGTELAPRNPGVEAWETLSDDQQRLGARLQEAFAAFLDHTDAQIGRLVEDLNELGVLDNTLLLVMSDNGASQEGGPFGVLHEMKFFNGILETPDQAVHRLDDIGGPNSHANYPWGWAQAGNTPFKWYKQNTHEGGVHVPLIVRWPDRIADPGEVRHQFHHVTDVAPAIYEAAGVARPSVYRGLDQIPMTGTSLLYTLDQPDAPSRKPVQYFEMGGHRGLWHDGWKAVTRHIAGVPYDDDQWELYHVEADFSECHDLAEAKPEKLAELIERWWEEADKHGVLPLDDRTIELFGTRYADHTPHPTSRRYVYRPPMSPMPAQVAPTMGGRAWHMQARITRPTGADGVLFATGTANAGLSWFVEADRLVLDYNAFGEHTVLVSDRPLPDGAAVVGVSFERSQNEGDVTLHIDGEPAGTAHLPLAMRIMSSVGPSVGYDHGSPVSPRYVGPNRFQGVIHSLEVVVAGGSRQDAEAVARAEMARQ